MQALTPQEKDVVKAGLILAVVLVAAVFYYFFQIVAPQIEKDKKDIVKVQEEIRALNADMREIEMEFRNLEDLKRKAEFLARIAKKLPESPDAPGFLQALIKILEVTRVTYSDLIPLPQSVRTVYTEIPYRIQGQSRFHDLGQFLNLIEENPDRFMRVKTFTIENDDTRPSLHPATVEIGTFMFNSRG
jgi:Tfp pilus assembly protein PilO